MIDHSLLRVIARNTHDELVKASYGEPSSLSYIKYSFSKFSMLPKNETFQILVIGGTVCRKALGQKSSNTVTLLQKSEFLQPQFHTLDEFLQFLDEHIDRNVLYIALNFAYPLLPKSRDGVLDGFLITGSKENEFSGLIDKLVGKTIEEYFLKKYKKRLVVSLANDVVCLLLSGKESFSSSNLGCGVVGTGINFAIFDDEENAINLESSNFSLFPLSNETKQIDEFSSSPGKALFEKEVAGGYLFQQLNYTIDADQLPISKLHSTKELKELALSSTPAASTAYSLLEKSAAYIAAHIAGITDFKNRDMHFVMEGGFFWGDSIYKSLVEQYLQTLTSFAVTITAIPNSPYIGASFLL